MSSHTRGEAHRAVEGLRAQGGTAMGTWLTLARQIFETVPHVTKRHAILLTDGVNEGETPPSLQAAVQIVHRRVPVRLPAASATSGGSRRCARIASALLGTVDLIPEPEEMAAEFEAMMRASMARGVANAELRVWAPQGAELLFVRQVSPDARGPHGAPHAGQPAHRGLPDGCLVRREPRLPRGRAAAGAHARAGAARRARVSFRSAPSRSRRGSSRPSGATTTP